ncbi:PREDICTED: uncharacterized protein LOC104802132 isoform X1 [Tarenaya hassleriana]|uniref:uncharacterized protein LOC104802132 isoform X1 n=1 Tax=Tarenaya hassleriana TaxID=28532 RepID=UPI00053C563A|nr:PREDICTED: uncharacterized protein LOC104802132 isoform X1 [Tarenaya hassleriana]
MALILYSYDFICFAIVAAAVAASLWLLLVKEGSDKGVDGPTVESLLVGREENEVVGFRHDGGETQVGSARLWTSCWRGMHPVWLLATRSVSFLVLTALLTWDVMEWGSSIFVYYTEWTFALVMIYFAMGIIASAYGCFKSSDFNMEHRQRLSIWGYLMQAVYQTCGGAVVLTDIVFWLVIVPFLSNSHLGLNLLTGCMHIANFVLLLLDTALNNLPFPWYRIAYFVQWSCLYVVFQWIIHACGFTWWPYPFLELDRPWAPIWYLCMTIVHIPCYGAYAAIVRAKNSNLPNLFPNAFVKSYC